MKVGVAQIPGKGRGVISYEKLTAGENIVSCPVIVMNKEDTLILMQTALKQYQYPYDFDEEGNPDYQSGRIALALGVASLLNCSADPNAYWAIDPRTHTLHIEAVREISEGMEITINYGFTAEQMLALGWIE